MNNSTEITSPELAKILCLKPRNIAYHVGVGNLPQPIKRGEEIIFDKGAVAQKLGLDNLDEPFLDLDGAAKFLGVNAKTVRQLVRDNKYLPLPYFKMNYHHEGSPFRFRASELTEYLKQRQAAGLIFSGNHEYFHSSNFKLKYLSEIFEAVLDNAALPTREAEIVKSLVIDNESLQRVSERYYITRERVRQIFVKAMIRLRYQLVEIKNLKTVWREQLVELENLTKENQLLRQAVAAEELKEEGASRPLPIGEVGLSVRAYSCLRAAKIKDLNELKQWTEWDLLKVRNLGRKTLQEIVEAMVSHGLTPPLPGAC